MGQGRLPPCALTAQLPGESGNGFQTLLWKTCPRWPGPGGRGALPPWASGASGPCAALVPSHVSSPEMRAADLPPHPCNPHAAEWERQRAPPSPPEGPAATMRRVQDSQHTGSVRWGFSLGLQSRAFPKEGHLGAVRGPGAEEDGDDRAHLAWAVQGAGPKGGQRLEVGREGGDEAGACSAGALTP